MKADVPQQGEKRPLADEVRVTQPRGNGVVGDVVLLHLLLLLALVPILPLRRVSFTASMDLYASIEMLGATLGMLTGFALCLRFYSLGNRYHLFVGLAFFVSGIKDLVHGLVCFRNLLGNAATFLREWLPRFSTGIEGITEDFIPVTYVAGQLLLSFMLLLALTLPGWLKRSSNRERETSRVSLIVLLLTLLISLTLDYSSSQTFQQTTLRPVVLASLAASFFAMFAYVLRYYREQDLLSWWIAGALGINGVGQIMFLSSSKAFDAAFELAHLYKIVGYVLPLIGFFFYQVAVVLEYQRIQRELTHAREMALAATKAKSEFLANISHEIRTPMNGIVGMTKRILKTPLNEEQSQYLQALRDSADSLLSLLNDLLDFSKFESGKFDLHVTMFSLPDCIDEAHRSISLAAQEKGLRTEVSIAEGVPETLAGDGVRLRQILVNLLSNAVKFTESGEISLRVRRYAVHDDKVELKFTVRDTGIGIPTELQSDIFQPFRQADGSTTRLYGGTGLGLAICSQLVELMQGRIWVESEPGFGSKFHFLACFGLEGSLSEIDLFEELEQAPVAPAVLKTRSPLRVLVAEDNKINRELVAASLQEMGHRVRCVSNGREAVQSALGDPPDVILMDLQMPELGGLEATQQIRQRSNGKSIRIFALTAHAMDSDKQRCLDAGMDGFLTKPVDDDQLFCLLETGGNNTSPTGPADDALSAGQAAPRISEEPSSIIDWEKLLRHVRQDMDLLAEVTAMFEEQAKTLLTQMRQAIERQDSQSLAQGAHKLAGSVGNFHTPPVREAAVRLEAAAKANDPSQWHLHHQRTENLIEQMLAELRQPKHINGA